MEKQPGLTLFRGKCGRDGSSVTAYPMQFEGKACFESRQEPPHTCESLTAEEFATVMSAHRAAVVLCVAASVHSYESFDLKTAIACLV